MGRPVMASTLFFLLPPEQNPVKPGTYGLLVVGVCIEDLTLSLLLDEKGKT
jgi:hypothetical protein